MPMTTTLSTDDIRILTLSSLFGGFIVHNIQIIHLENKRKMKSLQAKV